MSYRKESVERATKETCKTVYDMLKSESGKLIHRMVSIPHMSQRDIEGITGAWTLLTDEMDAKCNCPNISKVGKDIEKALDIYKKDTPKNVGKAVLKVAEAAVTLGNKARQCKII